MNRQKTNEIKHSMVKYHEMHALYTVFDEITYSRQADVSLYTVKKCSFCYVPFVYSHTPCIIITPPIVA